MAEANPTLAMRDWILRFAAAVTSTFILCEWMQWGPTFLAPVLAGVILASLPAALPFKEGVAVMMIMSVSAFASYVLASLLHNRPDVLFGIIGLIIFLSFAVFAKGKGKLPIILLLICIATIPIFTLVSPEQAGALPIAYARGMALAVISVWIVQAVWPRMLPKSPAKAENPPLDPFRLAVAGTAIVLPIMLLYLMYGITDALPILMSTILLVTNFDPALGKMQAMAMMIGNFVGGIVALIAYHLLQIAPTLGILAMLTFLIGLLFASRLVKGGKAAPVVLLTFNQAMIIFGISLASSSSNAGLWITRLSQFAFACVFALSMMVIFFPRKEPAPARV